MTLILVDLYFSWKFRQLRQVIWSLSCLRRIWHYLYVWTGANYWFVWPHSRSTSVYKFKACFPIKQAGSRKRRSRDFHHPAVFACDQYLCYVRLRVLNGAAECGGPVCALGRKLWCLLHKFYGAVSERWGETFACTFSLYLNSTLCMQMPWKWMHKWLNLMRTPLLVINSYCGCMHGTFLVTEIEICILIGWILLVYCVALMRIRSTQTPSRLLWFAWDY